MPINNANQRRWVQATEVVWEELGQHALLIHGGTGGRWTLNAAALRIWKLCDGSRGVQALSQATGLCAAEIERFIYSLHSTGMLRSGAEMLVAEGPEINSVTAFSRLSASYQQKGLTGARKRPSPRGNSGPG